MNSREYNNDSNFPCFLKSSFPGNGGDVVNESAEFLAKSEECCASARPYVSGNIATSPQDFKEVGISSCSWTKSLQYMPAFDVVKLDEHLIVNQRTMAKIGKSPKAYRNKKQGYQLSVNAARDVFLVNRKVHASMKPVVYQVTQILEKCEVDVPAPLAMSSSSKPSLNQRRTRKNSCSSLSILLGPHFM